MICALGILLILFCFGGFFLFIATVYIFADCNNELLVKKKIHFVNNKNNVHVLF